ncbi:retrovirus-related pol polyprotein from transposon TNT 1-94 [Tanacetum coccineum]|uniref:Retrovirus-related pol polyprotein from transposon TNT 1-94 n=1 Tax=Tanacetum coccineum TaxID=301880 RepID=A0ABQ5B556_9ASTR
MSTQQDIYAAGSENRPPMLNKENYVPWSSRLLRYAKSRPNGKLIYNSIMNGPYVRRMIPEPGDADREVPVPETFHEQTDDELTVAEIKQMEADDQAIQTILLGLPEDIYAAVDSCETAQEIWLRVQQMMKGSDIGIQEKKAKLFNEWERFTSTDGESIESYYHRFSKLMNDFKRNKHFPEKIASNLKFLNNLQPEWSRHVTIVHQTKDLHTTDYTQLYDFLKYNQKEVDDQRAERLAKTHDPLALMANSNNPFNYPVFHQDQPSPSTYMQQPQPINNNYNPQPSFNQNYMQQPMPNPEDITDPTTAMNMALALMAKAFKLNYSTPTNNNQRISSNPRNRQIAQPGMNMGQDRQMRMVGANGGNQFRQYAGQNVGYQNGYNAVQNVGNQVVQDAVQNQGVQNIGNQNGQIGVQNIGNGNVVAARAEGNAPGNNGNQIRCYNCRGLGHLARNCTVRPRRRDAAYLQTQLLIAQKEEAGIQLQAEEFDLMAAAADLDEIEEVNANCILMANLQQASTSGTQTDKAPVYDSDGSAEVQLSDNCYNNEIFNMFNQEEHVEQGGGTVEQHSATVEETRAYHESLFHNLDAEVEKVNSVNRKMKETNAELTTELARYKNQLLKEKATVSSLQEEKKRLKSDFKIREDKFLDKQIQLENKIKELDNILVKTDIHNWSSSVHQEIHKIVKDENFPIVNQVDDRVQNFEIQFLKEAAKFVRDFQSLRKEVDESLAKHKALELEIKRLLRAVVSQDIMSIVQNNSVVDTSNLQTELERTKEHTLDPLPQKLENENVELEYQVRNYEKEDAHLKTAYKNLFDSINVTRAQTEMIIDSFQNKLHDTIYENAKLRAQLFDKVSEQKDTTKGTSTNTKFANQSTERKPSLQSLRNTSVVRQPKAFQSKRLNFLKTRVPQKVDKSNDLPNPVTSNSVPTTKELKVAENDKVIAPGMFRINPFKNSRDEKFVPNKPTKASVRTNPITVSQPHVITKKVVNSDSHGFSSTGVDITTKTRRLQPRSNTKNDRVPSAYKSSRIKNKEVEVEEHSRNLLLSKNKKHISSECNNIKLAIRNDKYEIVCAMCKQCLITANHDVCVLNYVNGMNSRRSKERLASPKPSKPRMRLTWSPTRKMFDIKGKLIASSESNGDNACTLNPQEPIIKRFPNSTFSLGRLSKYFLGTVRFGNDHVAAILGFGDLQWENILITRVYFVEGLRPLLPSRGYGINGYPTSTLTP